MSTGHNHSTSSSKICCPQHVVEMSRALKQQGRLSERPAVLRKFLDSHSSAQIMLALKDDSHAKHKFLKICNEEICGLLLGGTCEVTVDGLGEAKAALDKLHSVYKGDLTINSEVKSAFLNNLAAYYERTEDYASAITVIEEAIKADKKLKDNVACAIDYNNKAVFLMSLNNFSEAYDCSAKALGFLEHTVPFAPA